MHADKLYRIDNCDELEKVIGSSCEMYCYGAGFYLEMFFSELQKRNPESLSKFRAVLVSDLQGNPDSVHGIVVKAFEDAKFREGAVVFLTVGDRFIDEIAARFAGRKVRLYKMDFNMFQEDAYLLVKKDIQPFLNSISFLRWEEGSNSGNQKKYAWTCWWQGDESAPAIIKVCIASQRRHLPIGMEHIVITEENYRKYIDLPIYILDGVKKGTITITTLSDIIRACLLNQYGGLWMDAALLVSADFPKEMWEYPVYTRNLPGAQFCSNAMWSGWFISVYAGNCLYKFVKEAFFYYFRNFKSIKQYLMIDYLIAIACNECREIEAQFREVPYNNGGALELGRHLFEKYDPAVYERSIKDAFVHKITYKIPEGMRIEGTIFEYLILKNEEEKGGIWKKTDR